MTGGMRAARLLAAETEAFRDLEAAAPDDHLAHIRAVPGAGRRGRHLARLAPGSYAR